MLDPIVICKYTAQLLNREPDGTFTVVETYGTYSNNRDAQRVLCRQYTNFKRRKANKDCEYSKYAKHAQDLQRGIDYYWLVDTKGVNVIWNDGKKRDNSEKSEEIS